MKIKNLLFLVFLNYTSFAQINNLVEKFVLPTVLEENSRLLFYNNKLITHNDSGGQANLYELDTITNQVTRIINITNANNTDWEDITQDNNYIYIGDFGNNYGTRTDLKIYKIDKLAYDSNNTVTASVINFSYEDQTDFSDNPQTNFDAEAMIITNNSIHIFTKNRGDYKTKQYTIPNTAGTHSATLLKTYDIDGLITGASFNPAYSSVFLIGYSYYLNPFVVLLEGMNTDISFNDMTKIDLFSEIGKNQIEGISLVTDNHFFVSSEKFTYNSTTINQKLFSFDYDSNVININDTYKSDIVISPNPMSTELFINHFPINSFFNMYNSNGILIYSKMINTTSYSWKRPNSLANGVYFIKITSETKNIAKKILLK